MLSKAPNKNRFWTDLIIEELVRNGITTFYAAPGSRSAPLIMAAAAHEKVTLHVHFDERGTAFQALGYAMATGGAAAWITTSGTALANGYPAIVEASMEGVPMILLTADRPPELRDTDANQTIRQDGMFGKYVRWAVDLAPPSDEIAPEYVLTTVDHAVARSSSGPVHLNCMFREPLAPDVEPYSPMLSQRYQEWESGATPFTTHERAECASDATISNLIQQLSRAERVMIVLGRLRGDGTMIRAAVRRLSESLGAPFLADITSQVRLGLHAGEADASTGDSDLGMGVAHAEAILYGDFPERLRPDLILQFGATSLSKRVMRLSQSTRCIVVDNRVRRIDPTHSAAHRIFGNPVSILQRLGCRSQEAPTPGRSTAWTEAWKAVIKESQEWLHLDLGEELTEQTAARALSECLRPGMVLAVASSASIRHFDLCAATEGVNVPLHANRGASGIDGTLASAAGFGDGHKKRPVVFVGDLALLHDINSLALCKRRQAIVIAVNNDGGGIFSYLPVAQHEQCFEDLFGTPHGMNFENAALQFGLRYERVVSIENFKKSFDNAADSETATLIEINTNRTENLNEQKRILRAMSLRVQKLGED